MKKNVRVKKQAKQDRVVKSIYIRPDLAKKISLAAYAENRNFSSFIAILLENTFGEGK